MKKNVMNKILLSLFKVVYYICSKNEIYIQITKNQKDLI